MVVIDSGREADLLAQKAVVRGFGFDLPIVTGRERELFPLEIEGRDGVNLHDTAHGVAAVERSLRAAQNFDALDVAQFKIKCTLVEVGDIIDIHPDGLPAAPGADTADVDSRSHARTVVRDIQIRDEGAEVFQRTDLPPVDLLGSEDGDRAWEGAEVVCLFCR